MQPKDIVPSVSEAFLQERGGRYPIMGASPFLHAKRTTRGIMTDVLIALAPAVLWSVFLYGFAVLPHYILSILTAVLTDRLWGVFRRRPRRFDISPVVTGTLLAMSLPVSAPLWFGPLGAFFGILIAKEVFGGIGQNFVNPALAGRALLRLAFEAQMTANPMPTPLVALPVFVPPVADAVTTATPLMAVTQGMHLSGGGVFSTFLGLTAGKLGETSALLLLLGGAYLLVRGVIRWRIPFSMLGTIAAIAWIFGSPLGLFRAGWDIVLGHVLGGASILGAFFMATDYASSPNTPLAQVLYGVGLGIVTMLFRFFSGYSEGFTFAALIMNLTVPLMNRFMRPRVLGEGKQ